MTEPSSTQKLTIICLAAWLTKSLVVSENNIETTFATELVSTTLNYQQIQLTAYKWGDKTV
jgi:hypothetical protein